MSATLESRMLAAQALVDRLSKAMPRIVREMSERAADGHRRTTIGAGPDTSRHPVNLDDEPPIDLTSVEAATLSRWRITNDWDRLTDAIEAVAVAAHAGLNIGERYTPEPKEQTCNGGLGRDGAYDPDEGGPGWGARNGEGNSAHCGNTIEQRYGLCLACYHREYRWRRKHGYPQRNHHAEAA